ncbi:hypothetical protein [Streptomyces sp. Ac-502]|uniref:hypothetical protein n=1 Tax=Streptomyces sp. Ac-502 TaxID=3342801 RepID=UPI0038623DFA
MALAERPSKAWEVADLISERLFVMPNPLAAWSSVPFWVSVWKEGPGRVLVSVTVPRESADPFIQLQIGFPVTEESPESQAERILAAVRQPHPWTARWSARAIGSAPKRTGTTGLRRWMGETPGSVSASLGPTARHDTNPATAQGQIR